MSGSKGMHYASTTPPRGSRVHVSKGAYYADDGSRDTSDEENDKKKKPVYVGKIPKPGFCWSAEEDDKKVKKDAGKKVKDDAGKKAIEEADKKPEEGPVGEQDGKEKEKEKEKKE